MEQEELASVLSKALAWISATQPLIEALVMSHPDPTRLRDAWHAQLPQQVEDEMGTPPFEVNEYCERYIESLSGISNLIDAAARRHTGGGSK
jgi:hypothetical protein